MATTRDLDTPVPTALPLGRDSLAWRVNAEPAALAGGGRALLMQVAHPGVGAGVEQHSTYASDPWGRFFRTMDIMMKLSFGTPEASARQARILASMHRRVRGTTEGGQPYSALDPQLQLWVWATLVDTASLMYGLVRSPLLPDEQARFYEESKLVAYGCGVPVGQCPGTWGEFQAYVDHVVAQDLKVDTAARSVAHATMIPPLPDPFDRVAAVPNQLVTVGLLAPSLRSQFGFTWDAEHQRQLQRYLLLVRISSRLAPSSVRQLGARWTVAQRTPMRVPWLQRQGAARTADRMASFEPVAS